MRRGLHREAAQRLAQSGASPLRVAEHFARGVAADDPFPASIAMTTLAMICESRGRFADALRTTEDALRLAGDSLARHGHQYPVQVSCGYILVELDRLEAARSALHAGRRISEERGIRWPLPSYAG